MWMTYNFKLLWAILVKESNGYSHCSFVIRGDCISEWNVYRVIILIMNVVFLTSNLFVLTMLKIFSHRH